MTGWLTSRNGVSSLTAIAFLTFLGRAFMDWRYEYPLQDPEGSWVLPGALIYTLLAGAWLWSLIAADRGSRRALTGCLIWVLVLDVLLALATLLVLCPPWSDCEAWPTAYFWNWLNLITGIAAAATIIVRLRKKQDGSLLIDQ